MVVNDGSKLPSGTPESVVNYSRLGDNKRQRLTLHQRPWFTVLLDQLRGRR